MSTTAISLDSVLQQRAKSIAHTAIAALCVFSVVNPLIQQAGLSFFPYSIAGMNVMQLFQGMCFPLVLVVLPRLPRGCAALSHPFSVLLWAYVMSLGILHLRLLSAGRIPPEMVNTERMVYFKIIFALVFWYFTSRLVQSHETARRVIRSIVIGAVLSAGWVVACYFFGLGGAHYEAAGVRATAGSEGASGKAVAGFLLPAAVGAMYLAFQNRSYRWALGAVLVFGAVFVTFDRSAQVACSVAMLWMALWYLILARPRPDRRIVLLFLGILVLVGGVYYTHHGTEELISRWTSDFDRGEIGSGRGAFYTTAWHWFWKDSGVTDFLLGVGYGNIYDIMHTGSGLYRHTHSDLFDLLMIGGVVGLMLYVFLFYTIASLGRDMSTDSMEFGTLGALLLSFGVMSLLTGLTEFPHTVYAFGGQCICLRVLALREVIDTASLPSPRPAERSNHDFRRKTGLFPGWARCQTS